MLNDSPGCFAAIDRMIVGPDLQVYPFDAFKRIGASDLVKTDKWSRLNDTALADCWNHSPYLEAVRTYLTTDFKDPCESCNALERCVSGCLAQKAITYGTLDKRPDPDCLKTQAPGRS
jgi:radical SAM protein with 4Fe4S-binding SPASM domain